MSYVEFICNDCSYTSLGELLEDEMYKRGINTKLPSSTDWGYVFKASLNKHEFDIFVEKVQNIKNKFSISISSTLNKIEKLFGKNDDYESKSVGKIIDDILKLNSGFKEIVWIK